MTLIELLVVMVVIFILASMLLPTSRPARGKARQLRCLANVRQLGIALNMFANDHAKNFPWQIPTSTGGSLEKISSGSPTPHFQTLSNYLNSNWLALHCPADISRRPTTDPLLTLNVSNISYFCTVDAVPGQLMSILVGDRNLAVSNAPVKPGLSSISTNTPIAWTSEGHGSVMRTPSGSLAFADGHTEISRTNLPALVQRQNLATNRLAIP